ncbi:hypothetical protein [Amycolatopsis viridis]|uniref:Secreted protein n=1 Tax=Amycolatopsis viridis TaxID=185678 RepID=A0ABX0SMY5_9PSEU|nr:hypothetical protein [Amycolatopsis viridis]NIH77919.1 hypothetical protein [Amycolatopsis viridis]
MELRRTLLAAGAVAATATAVLAGTSTAAAAAYSPPGGWDHIWRAADGTAVVYVEEHGDVIKLCDTKRNSFGAFLAVWKNGSIITNWTAGDGGCKTHQASEGKPYDLPEGVRIELRFHGTAGGPDTRQSFTNDH